jgi:hypothetical protein
MPEAFKKEAVLKNLKYHEKLFKGFFLETGDKEWVHRSEKCALEIKLLEDLPDDDFFNMARYTLLVEHNIL